jgi:hypothetical protein
MTTAVACWEDLIARVMQVSELSEKTVSVLSEQDLLSILKLAKFPMAGVVYGGIAANSLDPSRQGMAADLTCTVLLIIANNAIGGLDQKNEAARLLDEIRKQVRMQTSPTFHKWRFVSERPAGTIGNAVVYRQQWSTAIILTS